jgi:hypothetical protein
VVGIFIGHGDDGSSESEETLVVEESQSDKEESSE